MVILLGADTGLSRIMYSPLPAIHPLQPQFITTAIQLHPGILVCLWTRVLNSASTRRGANNKDGGLPESSGYCAIGGNSTNPKRKKSAKTRIRSAECQSKTSRGSFSYRILAVYRVRCSKENVTLDQTVVTVGYSSKNMSGPLWALIVRLEDHRD